MSFAPGSTATPHMQPPMSASQSLQRRSSVYSRPSSTGPMGHQSFFTQGPIPAGVPRDPRPLKDRTFQNKIGQELSDYLTRNNFELQMGHSLGQKSFVSPTQKDFNLIFQWLYHRIDPAYKFQKNIDAEVPPILKQLRYPYEKSITKSQIAAVGGQNWSTFLGMLHWMMQLAQMLDRYEVGEYDDACAEAGVDVSGDRIIFRFLSGAYRDWLEVTDDEDDGDRRLLPHVEAMATEFERGNQHYAEEMKILEAENITLRQQIEEIEREMPNMAKLDNLTNTLENDIKKFHTWNVTNEKRAEKHENRNEMLSKDLEVVEVEMHEAQQEKERLQAAVDRQGITIQDIDRMNSERERLQKAVETAMTKMEEVRKKVTEKEMETSSKLEDLERTVDKYNSLCYHVGLIPSSALNAKGDEFELHLTVNDGPVVGVSHHGDGDRLLHDPSTGYHPAHVLNLDLRGNIRIRLNTLKKEVNKRRNAASDEDVENQKILDDLSEAIDDKRNEIEALEHRVRAAEEEFEKTKEVCASALNVPSSLTY